MLCDDDDMLELCVRNISKEWRVIKELIAILFI